MNANADMRRLSDSLMNSARENPIGAALLGMGLVWLVASRTGAPQLAGRALSSTGDAATAAASAVGEAARKAGSAVSDMGASATSTVRDTAGAAYKAVRGAAGAMRENAQQATDQAVDMAGSLSERAAFYGRDAVDEWNNASLGGQSFSAQMRNVRNWMAQTFEQQPLILAAGALAVGAAIAATLPVARVESETIGDTARRVVDKAAGLASEGLAQAVDKVDDAVCAAQDEAKRQGLTPDAIAAQAGKISDKARDAAAEAGKALSEKGVSSNSLL